MRWFVALLIAVMCFMATSAFASNAFEDVPRSHWAYEALQYLHSKGIVEGYPDGFWKGDRTLTRYEFAQAIARVVAYLEENSGTSSRDSVDVMVQQLESEFRNDLDELEMQSKDTYGEVTQMNAKVGDLEAAVNDNADKIAALEESFDNLKPGAGWKGDFRYRWQFNDQNDTERFRHRIRLRLGYSKELNEAVKFGFRLATVIGSKISYHHTLGDGSWTGADIYVDKAWVRYSPVFFGTYSDGGKEKRNVDIYAGIFDQGVVHTDPAEIVLTGDVSMQGMGLVYHFNENVQLSGVASCLYERKGDEFDDDTYFFGTELRWDNFLIPALDVWGGVYGFNEENNLMGVFDGNSLMYVDPIDGQYKPFDFNQDGLNNDHDRFSPNFYTAKAGLKYTWKETFPKPLSLWGEFAWNFEDEAENRIDMVNANYGFTGTVNEIEYDNSDDYGWVVGGSYGKKPKNVGEWIIKGFYKEVGANVAIDGYTDTDTGVNSKSFQASWNYMWADNCILGIDYILVKMHNAFGFTVPSKLDDENIVKVNWNFKF